MTQPKYAYATLVTNKAYVIGAQVLARSHYQSRSKYPLIVLQTGLDEESLELLRNEKGIAEVQKIDILLPSKDSKTAYAMARFEDVWTKFRAWALTEYDMVCLLDADMLITRNIDDVFSLLPSDKHLAAAPACTCNIDNVPSYPPEWNPANCLLNRNLNDGNPFRALNAGLMVFRPDLKMLQDMEELLAGANDLEKYKFPEQDWLQEVYPDWVQLPWIYNGLKTIPLNHLNIWSEDEHRIIHYIKEKPWNLPPGHPDYASHRTARLNDWWWNAYHNDGDWQTDHKNLKPATA
ncbi:hypothetical protein HDV00_006903 [Rhizophlyctis rosea]|nr:hypothetical protein HDV00_006903 [Rhizophlyctis rosea]